MTDLHARVELLEGALDVPLAGAAEDATRRAFAVLSLMRGDGTTGAGAVSYTHLTLPTTKALGWGGGGGGGG